jgi:hypothetical protein
MDTTTLAAAIAEPFVVADGRAINKKGPSEARAGVCRRRHPR